MSSAPLRLPLVRTSAASPSDGLSDALRGATSHEIIFAVVGHAGAGTTWVARVIAEGIGSFEYKPLVIKMSDLILEALDKLDPAAATKLRSVSAGSIERTTLLQAAGNWLRSRHGTTFTAALAIKRLHDERQRREKTPDRAAYILDSLKNPFEVDALRKLYGRSLYVISVVCGHELRKARLITKYKVARTQDIDRLMLRDEAESEDTGQHVRKTLKSGDFFVNNEENVSATEARPLDKEIRRFLQIVFTSDVVRPTIDERGMYEAWGASLRSACLSRQVGAAILNRNGQLIATGTNDVPKYGGGLYEENEGGAADHRCFRYYNTTEGETKGFCRNDHVKKEILGHAVKELREAGVVADHTTDASIIAALKKTPINDLLEFSRAVHAEMDAIVSLARSGGNSAEGATLYCTTYPCHPCARHIVATGIRDVVYVEPYLKSRAAKLHDDTIVETTKRPEPNSLRVHFRLFTGVAPWRYAALFQKRDELKQDGELFLREERDALHIDPIFTKSHIEFEQLIAKHVEAVTQAAGAQPTEDSSA